MRSSGPARTKLLARSIVAAAQAAYPVHRFLEIVESAVQRHVIERWSKHRAREFFNTFCACLAEDGIGQDDLANTLDALLSNEANSGTMFDAYRSVCLTKSRIVGPRIIALLTAKLVAAQGVADDDQELIFAAAEALSDSEFETLIDFVRAHDADIKVRRIAELELRELRVQVRHESHDLSWPQREMSLGPLNLANEVGTWASKLKQIGLVSDDVRERQRAYQEDSEAYIDMPGVDRRLTWWLTLSGAALDLASLALKATLRSK